MINANRNCTSMYEVKINKYLTCVAQLVILFSIFLDTFTTLEPPGDDSKECVSVEMSSRELPPWNGYGSYEDSAENCRTVEPKAPHRDFIKFLNKDR